jgi:hypothetical protein
MAGLGGRIQRPLQAELEFQSELHGIWRAAPMDFLDRSEIPYLIVLAAALVIVLGFLIFHRSRKPYENDESNRR